MRISQINSCVKEKVAQVKFTETRTLANSREGHDS